MKPCTLVYIVNNFFGPGFYIDAFVMIVANLTILVISYLYIRPETPKNVTNTFL